MVASTTCTPTSGPQPALDDYGSGFSNLHLVLDLGPDYLKIDGEFCKGIDQDRRRRAIVQSTVTMATDLGIATIIERVETQAELETVVALGVHYAQGYYLGRPASGAATAQTSGWIREAVG